MHDLQTTDRQSDWQRVSPARLSCWEYGVEADYAEGNWDYVSPVALCRGSNSESKWLPECAVWSMAKSML